MHHPPVQINVLLRALPAPPPRRRVFWAMATACRRRLARRWELTPRARAALCARGRWGRGPPPSPPLEAGGDGGGGGGEDAPGAAAAGARALASLPVPFLRRLFSLFASQALECKFLKFFLFLKPSVLFTPSFL